MNFWKKNFYDTIIRRFSGFGIIITCGTRDGFHEFQNRHQHVFRLRLGNTLRDIVSGYPFAARTRRAEINFWTAFVGRFIAIVLQIDFIICTLSHGVFSRNWFHIFFFFAWHCKDFLGLQSWQNFKNVPKTRIQISTWKIASFYYW